MAEPYNLHKESRLRSIYENSEHYKLKNSEKPFPDGPVQAQWSDTRPTGLREFPPERDLPKVFHYERPYLMPFHPSQEFHPFMQLMALSPCNQIEEFRFLLSPDPYDKYDKKSDPYDGKVSITFDKAMGHTRTGGKYDMFYGFSFPIPVLDVEIWLESTSGKRAYLFQHKGLVKFIKFKNGIPVIIPYIKMHMTWTLDIVTFKTWDKAMIDLMHKTNLPFHHYGIYTKEIRDQKKSEFGEKLPVLQIEMEIDDGEGKIYTPMPMNLALKGFV